MLLQVLDDGYLTDSLGRKLISKIRLYHDFKCRARQLKILVKALVELPQK
jgi:hypothetical protein